MSVEESRRQLIDLAYQIKRATYDNIHVELLQIGGQLVSLFTSNDPVDISIGLNVLNILCQSRDTKVRMTVINMIPDYTILLEWLLNEELHQIQMIIILELIKLLGIIFIFIVSW